MPDNKYCYPDSEVLKNKRNITDKNESGCQLAA